MIIYILLKLHLFIINKFNAKNASRRSLSIGGSEATMLVIIEINIILEYFRSLENVANENEQSICSARASVMIYDDANKKWVPAGTSCGLSKVHIYHNQSTSAFRVVGRKLHDHEVVINCSILKGLKYNQATPTFHQWRDNRQVYGLNFSSKDDADSFAQSMIQALDILNNGTRQPIPPPPPPHQVPLPPSSSVNQIQQQQQQPQQIQQQLPQHPPQPPPHQQQPPQAPPHQYHTLPTPHYNEEDMGYRYADPKIYNYNNLNNHQHEKTYEKTYDNFHHYQESRTMAREDIASHQERKAPQPPPGPPPPPLPGHHRTNSAPNAPPVPPSLAVPSIPPVPPAPAPSSIGGAPPPPPPPPPVGGAPPPPPPPPGSLVCQSSTEEAPLNNLAAALRGAKLRQTKAPDSESTGSSSSGGSIGRGAGERPALGGMMSMMDEMAATLARRRAKNKEPQSPTDGNSRPTPKSPGTSGSSIATSNGKSSGGGESPKPSRKRFGSTCEDVSPRVNGIASDVLGAGPPDHVLLEKIKDEILEEMKKEMHKCKQEIINEIKMELNRR
ncbi:Protein enabled-like protein [Armadillidium nasatum]|uniref:Protein enabled-like protein n=1 Tax=Armadillidium nasatum TaxID=96803 RepID=A0A5N5T458_9CRUS|nr:Protein enabled-like protein [Armadillidium nasatum]